MLTVYETNYALHIRSLRVSIFQTLICLFKVPTEYVKRQNDVSELSVKKCVFPMVPVDRKCFWSPSEVFPATDHTATNSHVHLHTLCRKHPICDDFLYSGTIAFPF